MDQNQYYTPNQVPSPKRTKFFAIAIAFIIIAIVGMLAYVFRDKLSGLFSGAKPVAVFCKSRNPVGIPGMQLTFAGLGGNGTSYSWSAPTGSPDSGDSQGFATVFNKIGNYSVTVTSGGASDTCNVRIIDPAPDLDFGSITLNGNDGINPYIGNSDRNIPCIAPLDTVAGQPFNLDTQTRFSLTNRGFADATGVMVKFTQSGISGAFDTGNVTVTSGTFTKISDTEGKWVIPSISTSSWSNITFKKSGVIASNINLTGQVMALDQTDFDRGGDDRAIMACATTDYLSAPNNTQNTPPASNPDPVNTDTPSPINTDLPAPIINQTPTPIKQTDTPTQEVKGVSTGTKIAAISPTPTIEPGINPNPIINPPPVQGESCEDAPSEAFLRQYGVQFRILHNAVLIKNTGPKCFRFTLKGHDVVTGNLYPFGEQVLKQTKVFTVSAGVTAIITLEQAPLSCSFQTDLQLGDKTGINEGVIAYDFMEHKCVNPPTGKLTCSPASQNGQVGQPVSFTATNGSLPIWTAPGGQPIGGRGSNFQTTYDTAGTHTVIVQSNGQEAKCTVIIGTPQDQTLTCAPANQTVQVGTTANFTATGGSGTYTWDTTGDNPTKPPTGASASFTFGAPGPYTVNVHSGTAKASCQVLVTTSAVDLSCTPETQTTTINTNVQFQARGGNGTYTWLATDGTPATGATANFTTKFATPTRGIAAKQVKVTSAGVDKFCYVTVNDVTTTQEQADLAVVKTASNSTPVINTDFTYTIVITNIGPNNASGISVRDQLPTGITLVAVHSGSPSQGTFNTSDGVWTVGALNVGRNATLLLNVRATQTGSIANTASITASSLPDPVTSNNQSTATINVSGGGGGGGGGTTYDVGVAKSASTLTPTVGQNVSFTITATNFSSNSVTNVTIRDVLPSQVAYVSHTQSTGSYNQGTGIWTLGTMSNGAQATLNIIATVNTSGSITNTTTVNGFDQTDSNSNNNQASVTLVASTGGGGGGGGGGSGVDLAVTKSVNNSAPTLGSNVIFTLRVFNNGPLAATNVTLRDQLPSGLVYISSNPSQGSYNQSTGIWTVGSLPVSTSANLQLTVTVNQAGTTTNTGLVNSLDQSDSNSSNNSASSSVTVGTPGSGTGADIGVTKSVNTDRPVVGSQIVFTINAVNYGPQAATGVTLTDLLPSQVTFVKYQATSGTYDKNTGIWNIGDMANGASAVLQITATVVKLDNFTNIVRVTSSSPTDPNTTNNQAQVTVTSTQAPGLPAAGFNTAAPIVIGFLFIFLALAVKFMGSTQKRTVLADGQKSVDTFTRFD